MYIVALQAKVLFCLDRRYFLGIVTTYPQKAIQNTIHPRRKKAGNIKTRKETQPEGKPPPPKKNPPPKQYSNQRKKTSAVLIKPNERT